MSFEKVIQGILKYLDREIYPTMSDWQSVLSRLAVARLVNNKDKLKEFLKTNPIMQTFSIIDSSGSIDIDRICAELKEQISVAEKIRIDTKILGAYTFYPDDVDKLMAYIKEC
jgi:hypothetical protein